MTVVAAVLAAGASKRLGRPKQLVQFRGEPLVRRALAATRLPQIAEAAVVLGADADEIAHALPLDLPVVRLANEAWQEGIASSIRTAVVWAEERAAAALVLLLVDQPLVEASHVARLIAAWQNGAPAAASAYLGVLGVPAVLGAPLFPDLRALRGARGAGSILRSQASVAAVPCSEAAFDVDTSLEVAALSWL
jgi:CTP:molybdopterin cytidylyltransferase MocA